MINRARFVSSLNFKVLCVLVLSLLLGVGVFYCARLSGSAYISKYYMSEDAVSSRRADIYNDFKKYVLQNHLSSRDSARIGEWTIDRQYATIVIRNDYARIEAGRWGATTTDLSAENAGANPSGGTYYLLFSDGVYPITISDSSQTRTQFLLTVASVVIACLVSIVVVFIYTHFMCVRITALSKSAQEIGRGDLRCEIYSRGNDEISILAKEMDDMRRSVISRIESERKAWQANSSLITAMSHDLRTPMTAMIGYLELLQNGEYAGEEQRAKFTSSAHAKAMELKELTDELFRYFLVFGNSDIPMELESFDAGILLDQLLGEAVIELRDGGYNVHVVKFRGSCSIRVDVLNLKRVFDNLFSNVKKYADKSRPVIVLSELVDEKHLSVCISNSKDKALGRVESSNIGLQTCAKIAEQLGGAFKTAGDAEHFMAELTLPAYPPLSEE